MTSNSTNTSSFDSAAAGGGAGIGELGGGLMNGNNIHNDTTASSAGIIYDPELIHTITTSNNSNNKNNRSNNVDVNLSDPEALEAHLQVLDVRQRLRARRRRAIRFFSFAFGAVVVILISGLGSTMLKSSTSSNSSKNNDNGDEGGGLGSTPTSDVMAASQPPPPPPPSDLAEKCALEALDTAQGIRGCEKVCEVADCCNVPPSYVLSCQTSENVNVCSQYQKYCGVLDHVFGDNDNGNNNDGTSSDVDVTDGTSSNNIDVDDTNSPPSDGGDSIDGTSPPPPSDQNVDDNSSLATQIQQLCGETPMEALGPPSSGGDNSQNATTTTCESICSRSYCCFNQICKPPPDMDCSAYAPCFVLYAEDTQSMSQQMQDEEDIGSGVGDTVHEACASLSLDVNNASADEECKSVCSPGACCFQDHLSCTDVECAAYSECIVLYPSFVSVTKDEVDDACHNHNDANLSAGGQPSLCEQVCTLHVMQCCFHVGGDCHDSVLLQGNKSTYCSTYESCDVLGTDPAALRHTHKDELETACSGGSSTRSKCIQLCSAATCCYSATLQESCAHVDASISCSDYKACDVLYG
jgi:hypothetical protein